MDPTWDPRAMWKLWLNVWSQAMDGYLRSPAFLQFMQHGLGTLGPRAPSEPVLPPTPKSEDLK